MVDCLVFPINGVFITVLFLIFIKDQRNLVF